MHSSFTPFQPIFKKNKKRRKKKTTPSGKVSLLPCFSAENIMWTHSLKPAWTSPGWTHCRSSVPCCCFLRFSSPGFCWSSTGTARGTSREDAPHQLPVGCSNIPSTPESWPSCSTTIFSTTFLGWRSCYRGAPVSSNKGILFPLLGWTAQIKTKGKLSLPQHATIWPCFPLGKGNKGPGAQRSISELGKGLKENSTGLLSLKKSGVACLSISARRQDRKRSLGGRRRQQTGTRILHITY